MRFLLLKGIVCNFNNTENSTNEKAILQFHEDLFNICVFDNDIRRGNNSNETRY